MCTGATDNVPSQARDFRMPASVVGLPAWARRKRGSVMAVWTTIVAVYVRAEASESEKSSRGSMAPLRCDEVEET